MGGPLPRPYTLVLYEPTSKRHYSITTLKHNVSLGVPSAQYVTVEDDAGKNWSVHFASAEACTHLLQHATLVRARTAAARWVHQDVHLAGDGHGALPGDAIGVKVVAYGVPATLQPAAAGSPSGSPLGAVVESSGEDSKPQKVVLEAPPAGAAGAGHDAYEHALLGMRKGDVRYVCGEGVLRRVEVVRMKRANKEEPPHAQAASSDPLGLAATPEMIGVDAAGVMSSGELPAACLGTPEAAEPSAEDRSAEERERDEKAALVSRMAKLAAGRGMGVGAGMVPVRAAAPLSERPASAGAGTSGFSPISPADLAAAAVSAASPKLTPTSSTVATAAAATEAVVTASPQVAPLTPATAAGSATLSGTSLLALNGGSSELHSSVAQQLVGLARESRSMQGDVKDAVDSIARRLSSLTAAMEGIEQGVMRRAASPHPGINQTLPPPPPGAASASSDLARQVGAMEAEAARLRAALAESEAARASEAEDANKRVETAVAAARAEVQAEAKEAAAQAEARVAAAKEAAEAAVARATAAEAAASEAAANEAAAKEAVGRAEASEAAALPSSSEAELSAAREEGAADGAKEAEAKATAQLKSLMSDVYYEIEEKVNEKAQERAAAEGGGSGTSEDVAEELLGVVRKVVKAATKRAIG